MADPDQHWFQWLKDELTGQQIEVSVPALPEPAAPDLDAWVIAASAAIGDLNDDLVIVGHSAGCITAVKVLESRGVDETIGGLVMVSGFDQGLPTLPELAGFTRTAPDYARLNRRVRVRSVISSDNDEIVAPEATEMFARNLDARLTVVPGGGHFLGADGFVTLPAAAEEVRRALGPQL